MTDTHSGYDFPGGDLDRVWKAWAHWADHRETLHAISLFYVVAVLKEFKSGQGEKGDAKGKTILLPVPAQTELIPIVNHIANWAANPDFCPTSDDGIETHQSETTYKEPPKETSAPPPTKKRKAQRPQSITSTRDQPVFATAGGVA
jgi:hypothetical protein